MFALVGRISEQWKSRFGDKHTDFKKHPDLPRRVYFLLTLSCHNSSWESSIVGDRLRCISQKEIIPDSAQIGNCLGRFFNCVHTSGPYPGGLRRWYTSGAGKGGQPPPSPHFSPGPFLTCSGGSIINVGKIEIFIYFV